MGIVETVFIFAVILYSGAVIVDIEEEVNDINIQVDNNSVAEMVSVQVVNETVQESETIIPQIEYPDDWTCFDFAVNWSEQHPDWGMVVISDNPRFQGMNHLVNYKVNNDKSLQIISYVKQEDGYEVIEYDMGGWQYDTNTFDFLHFYIDGEIPTRGYDYLLPNAEVFYNSLMR